MLSYPPCPKFTHTHIQTDGDYSKHVVMTLWDHTLTNSKKHLQKKFFILFNFGLFFCSIFPLLFSGSTKGL